MHRSLGDRREIFGVVDVCGRDDLTPSVMSVSFLHQPTYWARHYSALVIFSCHRLDLDIYYTCGEFLYDYHTETEEKR